MRLIVLTLGSLVAVGAVLGLAVIRVWRRDQHITALSPRWLMENVYDRDGDRGW